MERPLAIEEDRGVRCPIVDKAISDTVARGIFHAEGIEGALTLERKKLFAEHGTKIVPDRRAMARVPVTREQMKIRMEKVRRRLVELKGLNETEMQKAKEAASFLETYYREATGARDIPSAGKRISRIGSEKLYARVQEFAAFAHFDTRLARAVETLTALTVITNDPVILRAAMVGKQFEAGMALRFVGKRADNRNISIYMTEDGRTVLIPQTIQAVDEIIRQKANVARKAREAIEEMAGKKKQFREELEMLRRNQRGHVTPQKFAEMYKYYKTHPVE